MDSRTKPKSNHYELKIVVAFVIGCCCIAIGCQGKFTKLAEKYPKDNPVEEILEDIAENWVEEKFNLPHNSLDGKFDFSPPSESEEDNVD